MDDTPTGAICVTSQLQVIYVSVMQFPSCSSCTAVKFGMESCSNIELLLIAYCKSDVGMDLLWSDDNSKQLRRHQCASAASVLL